MQPELLFVSPDSVLREQARLESSGLPARVHVCSSLAEAERSVRDCLAAQSSEPRGACAPPWLFCIDLQGGSYDQARQFTRSIQPIPRVFYLRGDPGGCPQPVGPVPTPRSLNAATEVFVDRPASRSELRALFGQMMTAMQKPVERAPERASFEQLIGRSVGFRVALEAATRAAAEPDSPVLIIGEPGSGKGIYARAIHGESQRSGKGFVEIDCRTLPAGVLERELFAPRSQADAPRTGTGLLGRADGGTLCLREIWALERGVQANLVTYIDAHRLWRIQQLCRPRYDLRIMATSERQLERDARAGAFNPELIDRLRGSQIVVPPLRDRPSDALLLAEHFLRRTAEARGVAAPALSSAARELLLTHPWPENVRQLKYALQQVAAASAGGAQVEAADLVPYLQQRTPQGSSAARKSPAQPLAAAQPGAFSQVASSRPGVAGRCAGSAIGMAPGGGSAPATAAAGGPVGAPGASGACVRVQPGGVQIELPDGGISFEEIEKAILLAALEKTRGNVVRAARLLRMGRGSLRYRLEKYDLAEPKRRAPEEPGRPRATSEESLRRAS